MADAAISAAPSTESVGKVKQRHKRELRRLGVQIKSFKRMSKLPKDELAAKVAQMEAELAAKHAEELAQAEAAADSDATPAQEPTPSSPAPAPAPATSAVACTTSDLDAAAAATGGDPSRMSRAAKKKAAKKAKEAARLAALRAEAEAEAAAMGNPKEQEMEALASHLAAADQHIVKVPADGNCLFAAVADQLKALGQDGADALKDVQASVQGHPATLDALGEALPVSDAAALRLAAVQFIGRHGEDFAAFLTNTAGDGVGVQAYCADMGDLSKGRWGGQPELLALARLLRVKLTVVQVDDVKRCTPSRPPKLHTMTMGEDTARAGAPTLCLAYHRHYYALGEHYNSVRRGSGGGGGSSGGGLMGDAQ